MWSKACIGDWCAARNAARGRQPKWGPLKAYRTNPAPRKGAARKGNRTRGSAWDIGVGAPAGKPATLASAGARTVVALRPGFDTMEEVDLLRHVLTGNDAAWNAFFRRFRGLILSCAIKVSTRSGYRLGQDDLMDVLGDVSLNLVANNYRRLRLYRVGAGCSVASWVGVIPCRPAIST